MTCTECTGLVSSAAAACPHCGFPVAASAEAPPPSKRPRRRNVWIHIDEQTPAEQKGGNPLFLKAVVIFVILLAVSLAIKVAVQGPTNGHGMSGPGPAYAVMTTAGVSTSVRLSTWPTEDELAHIADALRPSLSRRRQGVDLLLFAALIRRLSGGAMGTCEVRT